MSLYFRDYSFGIENNQFHAQNMVPVQNCSEVVVHNGNNLREKKKGHASADARCCSQTSYQTSLLNNINRKIVISITRTK